MRLGGFGHPGDGGFTVIEAIMVVVLLAILAAAVLIQNPIEKIRLNGAAEKVKSDIRYARKLAVSSGSTTSINFTSAGYRVYAISNSVLASSTGEACSTDATGKFVVDFTAARCGELAGITISYSPADGIVGFDSLGTPLDSSGVEFSSQQTVTVNGDAGSKTITIDEQTGRVSD